LVCILLTAGASAAWANTFTLVLRDESQGIQKTITDNDLIAGPGESIDEDGTGQVDHIVSLMTTVGNFTVDVYGTVFGDGGLASTTATAPVQMTLSNFLVSNKGQNQGTFTATLTRTGVSSSLFGPSVFGTAFYGAEFYTGSGSINFQSTVNGQTVLNQSTSVSLNPGPPPPSSTAGPIGIGGDFDLVNMLTFQVAGGTEVQADIALNVENVPEPTTLLLFGPGMLGLAAIRRRLRSKAL
jgi:hypothetical protein